MANAQVSGEDVIAELKRQRNEALDRSSFLYAQAMDLGRRVDSLTKELDKLKNPNSDIDGE